MEGSHYVYNVTLSRPPSGLDYHQLRRSYDLAKRFARAITPNNTYNSEHCPFNPILPGSPCVCNGFHVGGSATNLTDHCIATAVMYCARYPCDPGCASVFPSNAHNLAGNHTNGTGSAAPDTTSTPSASPALPTSSTLSSSANYPSTSLQCGQDSYLPSEDVEAGNVVVDVLEEFVNGSTWHGGISGGQLHSSPHRLLFDEFNWFLPQPVHLSTPNDDAYTALHSTRTSYLGHKMSKSPSFLFRSPPLLNITVVDDDVPLPTMSILLSRSSVPIIEGGTQTMSGSSVGSGSDTNGGVTLYLSSSPAPNAIVVLRVFNSRPDRIRVVPSGPFFVDATNYSIPISVVFQVINDFKQQDDVEDVVVQVGAFSNHDPRLMFIQDTFHPNATSAMSNVTSSIVEDWRSADFHRSRKQVNITLHVTDDDTSGILVIGGNGTVLNGKEGVLGQKKTEFVREGSDYMMSVRLKSRPTHSVEIVAVVQHSSSYHDPHPRLTLLGSNRRTITPGTWNHQNHTFTLRANDDVTKREERITIVSLIMTSIDQNYHQQQHVTTTNNRTDNTNSAAASSLPLASPPHTKVDLPFTVHDNDVAGIVLINNTNLTVQEGENNNNNNNGGEWSVRYGVHLRSRPNLLPGEVVHVRIRPTRGQCVLHTSPNEASERTEMYYPCHDDRDCQATKTLPNIATSNAGARCVGNTSLETDVAQVAFDRNNWNDTVYVRVRAMDDRYAEPIKNYGYVTHSIHKVNSSDPFYRNIPSAAMYGERIRLEELPSTRVMIEDNDPATVIMSPIGATGNINAVPLHVEEKGRAAYFQISLSSKPARTVDFVPISKLINSSGAVVKNREPLLFVQNGTGSGLAHSSTLSISFTDVNWDTPIVVKVSARDDEVDEIPRARNAKIMLKQMRANSNDLRYLESLGTEPSIYLEVEVMDNDVARLLVEKMFSSLQSLEEGDHDRYITYRVRLATLPTAAVSMHLLSPTGPSLSRTKYDACTNTNVTETLTNPPPQLRTAPISLVFTQQDWNIWKEIRVTANEDSGYSENQPHHVGTIHHLLRSTDVNYNGTDRTHLGTCTFSNGTSIPGCNAIYIPLVEVNVTENNWRQPPKLVSATFHTSGTGLTVLFDKETTGRGVMSCNDIFVGIVAAPTPWCTSSIVTATKLPDVAFGPSTRGCTWQSPSKVYVQLEKHFQVRPNDHLMLLNHKIREHSKSQRFSGNSTVPVRVPAGIVRPVARLFARTGTFVSSCSSISLDASGSYGSGGRTLRYNWNVLSASGAMSANLTSAVQAASHSRLNLPPSMFFSGRSYKFIVQVTSEWHPTYISNASISVTVASGSVPRVRVLGGSTMHISLNQVRGDHITIKGDWAVDTCPGSTTTSVRFASPSWHLVSTSSSSATLNIPCGEQSSTKYLSNQPACSDDSAIVLFQGLYRRIPHTRSGTISIPKSMLLAGITYQIGLFINIENELLRNNTAFVNVVVQRSNLAASIRGAEEATVPRDRRIIIDASSSFDPDSTTTQLEYSWNCIVVTGLSGKTGGLGSNDLCSNGTVLPLAGVTGTLPNVLVIPPATFEVGTTIHFTVNVTAADGTDRYALYGVKRTIAAGTPPEVNIEVTGFIGRDPTTGILRFNAESTPTFYGDIISSTGLVTFAWSVVNDDVAYAQVDNPAAIWSTPIYLPRVKLKPNMLSPPSLYKFRLTISDSSGSPSVSTMTLQMNSPPSSGILTIAPAVGYAFDTEFTMDASGWADDDLPLTYGFNDLGVVSSSTATSTLKTSTLKGPALSSSFIAKLGTGNNRTIQLVILDALGAATREVASVWVQKRELTATQAETEVENLMLSLISNIENGATVSVLEDSSTLFAAIGMLNENQLDTTSASFSGSAGPTAASGGTGTASTNAAAAARQNKNLTKARTAFRANILAQTEAALNVMEQGGDFDESTSLMVLAAVQGVTSAPTESDVNLRMKGLNLTKNVLEKVKSGGIKVSINTMDLVVGSLGNTLDGLSTAVAAETVAANTTATSTSTNSYNDQTSTTAVDEDTKRVTDGIKATLNVLKDAIMVDAVAGEEPLTVVSKDLSVTVQKVPKRSNTTTSNGTQTGQQQATHKVSLGTYDSGTGTASSSTSVAPPEFDIPISALPYDDDVEVLATSFTTNIYDTTSTAAGTIGLTLSKSGVNMPVNNLGAGSEIVVGFPVVQTYGLLPVPAYWNGTSWSSVGLVQQNSTASQGGARYLSFTSSHLTDFSATTVVDPATIVVLANETAVLETIDNVFGGTNDLTGTQSIVEAKILNVWNDGGTSDVDKLETLDRVMSLISPLAVPSVVGTSVRQRPDMAAQMAARATEAAPQLAVEIALQAVNQSYDTPTSTSGAQAAVLSIVNMVRNTSKTTYWATTPLATLFQSVANHNPTLRTAMLNTVRTLSSSEQTQTTSAGQAASISLPGGIATLDVPSGSTSSEGSTTISVREYECGLVSTDIAQLGRSCIGVAPHAFSNLVHLSFAVGEGATSCVKSSDEVSNDWHAIPKENDKSGSGTCVILNGIAHVNTRAFSVFSYHVGAAGLAFAGVIPQGPVTYARDVMTGSMTRRGAGSGERALQKLPNVTYKVPNGTYEDVGESTLVGFAVQPNVTEYPSSKGVFFSTGGSIRRVQNLESASLPSIGEMVVAGVTTVTIKGHSLGTALKDVAVILIKGTVCTSVWYVSSQEIGCVSGHAIVTKASR